jgi:hypothetical protein
MEICTGMTEVGTRVSGSTVRNTASAKLRRTGRNLNVGSLKKMF